MKQIIYTEWLKVKSYRTFWAMLALAVIIPVAGNYVIAYNLNNNLKAAARFIGEPFSFPEVWLTTASISSYISSLYGLLLIILVTNEFTFRTHRQNIIDGWERRQFVFSKLFWLVVLALLSLLVATLTGLIIGSVYGTKSFSLEGYDKVLIYFMQMVMMLCIALVVAIFARRAGIGIVIFLAYTMMLEQLLVVILQKNFGKIGGLLPMQTGDELLPFPVFGKLAHMGEQYVDGVYITVMLAWIALAIFIVFRKVLRSDL
ncbi:ABC transporter permease [Chitinophaga vietnamensis]|uniref:ABC transporter permease n=1 Tax=Chitinophaga vietnamensis TaxID=2593957 RepID=UPI001177FCA2|nr:ABC transporter permease [Chitinophaga vietnamensis]